MKAKKPNKKFNLEKFEIAKLNNPKAIVGGDSELNSSYECTDTDTRGVNVSSTPCATGQKKHSIGIEP
ncbi:MAG TPA: hypothetical protein VK476_03945 [Flavobacterium sp.]|nr:hypothetical protein [Flavobacterium sp.]